MPPPFNTSLVLSRLTRADLPTSIVATLVCHFAGLILSPILVYFMVTKVLHIILKKNHFPNNNFDFISKSWERQRHLWWESIFRKWCMGPFCHSVSESVFKVHSVFMVSSLGIKPAGYRKCACYSRRITSSATRLLWTRPPSGPSIFFSAFY